MHSISGQIIILSISKAGLFSTHTHGLWQLQSIIINNFNRVELIPVLEDKI